MKLIPVIINGKIHRLSERAMKLLNLEAKDPVSIPVPENISVQKLPPDLEIIKIAKKQEERSAPVEVKKKEDVTVASAAGTKAKPKARRRGKVGAKK